MVYQKILTKDHDGDKIGIRYVNGKVIHKVAIPYDYKYSHIIYFLCDDQGGEYGQFATLSGAILAA